MENEVNFEIVYHYNSALWLLWPQIIHVNKRFRSHMVIAMFWGRQQFPLMLYPSYGHWPSFY